MIYIFILQITVSALTPMHTLSKGVNRLLTICRVNGGSKVPLVRGGHGVGWLKIQTPSYYTSCALRISPEKNLIFGLLRCQRKECPAQSRLTCLPKHCSVIEVFSKHCYRLNIPLYPSLLANFLILNARKRVNKKRSQE